ncbi:MAG: PP2C family protein-serine/threonine phosphatase [Pseudonocardiaceae bacterium]
MTLVLRYAARSDRGLVRQNNQDAVYAGPRLLALADGMGGHAAGEVAAKVVIAAFAPLDDDEPGNDLLDQLYEATLAGNAAISELVREDPEREGMGTTLTAVLFAGNKIGLAHIGDSRAYLMRDGALSQITHDDTFVQSLIDEGQISEDEASHHPQRSLLLKALTGHEVEPSLTVREARAGDRYLLCSDGLSGVVSAETLADGLIISDPQACSDRLIELALKGGGPDNITCIVADVVDVDYGEDAPIIGGAAGDGVEQPQPDSAAARAATTTRPRPEPQRIEPSEPAAPDPQLRRRRRRRVLIGLAVLMTVLGTVTAIGSILVLGQYYVGATGSGEVVVFQGVPGQVFGLPLHAQEEASCRAEARRCETIFLQGLQSHVRADVRRGMISNNGLDGAREIIGRLRTNDLLPPCPRAGPGLQEQPSAPVTTSVPGQLDGGQSGQHPEPEVIGTPVPEQPAEPGVDCRTVS